MNENEIDLLTVKVGLYIFKLCKNKMFASDNWIMGDDDIPIRSVQMKLSFFLNFLKEIAC